MRKKNGHGSCVGSPGAVCARLRLDRRADGASRRPRGARGAKSAAAAPGEPRRPRVRRLRRVRRVRRGRATTSGACAPGRGVSAASPPRGRHRATPCPTATQRRRVPLLGASRVSPCARERAGGVWARAARRRAACGKTVISILSSIFPCGVAEVLCFQSRGFESDDERSPEARTPAPAGERRTSPLHTMTAGYPTTERPRGPESFPPTLRN